MCVCVYMCVCAQVREDRKCKEAARKLGKTLKCTSSINPVSSVVEYNGWLMPGCWVRDGVTEGKRGPVTVLSVSGRE